jgi:predicted KAP-like P-loop ATPase
MSDKNMVAKAPHNDKPISDPSEDRYGIDPFARALASSIQKMPSPEGTVVALNGPWGSGKSSAVNLVLHHLKDIDASGIVVVNFACWWFRGEEELALAFFRELYAGIGVPLGEQFKKLLPKIGARLLRAGSVVGAGIDLAGGGGAGAALADQQKRFLIVIDDIDRLAPDEALLVFRLVKSVGRLPNVIYLLVFDRQLADAVVTQKYPSEGPNYLEKIIQAAFDLPEPRHEDLRQELLALLGEICGTSHAADGIRFMNVFYDVVAPEIRTPRDLNRLANNLAVTWPAVGNNVDRADFIGLELLRLLRPGVYRAIRANRERVTATTDARSRWTDAQKEEFENSLLDTVDAGAAHEHHSF